MKLTSATTSAMALLIASLRPAPSKCKTPLSDAFNRSLSTLSVRKNSSLESFAPHAELILVSLNRGVSLASIARHIFKMYRTRYTSEGATYRALYYWVKRNTAL